MKVLAVELSSAAGSVAVADDGAIVCSRCFEAPRGRGAEVFAILEELRPHWLGLDRLALGIGPGSYNGLRVACALAQSFEMSLGIDLVAVPSPCLLDVSVPHYFAAGDARGGTVYVAEVRDRQLCGEILMIPRDGFSGFATAENVPVFRVGEISGAEFLPVARPDATILAQLAPELSASDPASILPIYLKPPHITNPCAIGA